MKWKILNVSIPVYDLNKSKEFYEILFGKNQNDKDLYRPFFDNEESVFLGRGGFGLRLYKPKPDLNITKFLQSRRSYISIIVDNIDQIKANLDKNNINYIFNNLDEKNSFKSLFVQEPSLNLIQFVEDSNHFNDDINGWNFGFDWGIHHMNLESLNVRDSINFFCKH